MPPDTPPTPSYRGLLALAFTYFGALLFAAMVAPWVYHGIQSWHSASPNILTEEIADNGFDDYFDRLRWIWVLFCLPWLIKTLDLRGAQALGLSWKGRDWKACFLYFSLGVLILAGVATLRLTTADFSLSPLIPEKLPRILLNALLGGLLVAFLEEFVFRSLIWRAFSMWRAILGGLVFASFFFAYTHYKMPDVLWDGYAGEIDLSAGLYVAWGTLIGFLYDASALDFVNLTLLGVWLSLLRVRSENLARSVGLHAGIVFALLAYVKGIHVESTPWRIVFGGPGLRDGIVTFSIFLLGIFIEARKCRSYASSTAS